MPLSPFTEIIGLPTFGELPYEKKTAVAKKYWETAASESDGSEQSKFDIQAQYQDSQKFLDSQEKLKSASPIQARFLKQSLADSATGLAVRQNVMSGKMTFEEGAAFAKQKSDERAPETEALKKTASLFSSEVDQEMQPAWQALEKSALSGQYFTEQDTGTKVVNAISNVLPGAVSYEDTKKSRDFYESKRNELATTFNLEPAEVDDLVRHRVGLQKDLVSRDAMGRVYIKDELLAKGNTDDLLKAINSANLSPGTKKQALVEAPIKIGMFKENIVSAVKQNYPELAAEIKFTGKLDEDYSSITKMLNDGGWEQTGSGAGSYLSKRVSQGEHVLGLFEDKLDFSDDVPYMEKRSREIKRRENLQTQVGELSYLINKEKVSIMGTDFATVGSGAASAVESMGVAALTGGAGTALISADRIAKAGKAGQILLGAMQRGLNTAPIATIYGTEQGLQTYEKAIKSNKSPDEALRLALVSGAIEGGITTTFGAIKLGGTEDIGLRLANPALRREAAKSIGKAWQEFGVDVVKGVGGEQLEELSISMMDSLYVQSQLNPGMTVDDIKSNLKATAVSTLFSSGPMSAISAGVEQGKSLFKSTYEQTTDQLNDTADKIATEKVLPQIEAQRRNETPPSSVTVGELERERTERIAEIEDSEEIQALREASVEELAVEWGVEIKEDGKQTNETDGTGNILQDQIPITEAKVFETDAVVNPAGESGGTQQVAKEQGASPNPETLETTIPVIENEPNNTANPQPQVPVPPVQGNELATDPTSEVDATKPSADDGVAADSVSSQEPPTKSEVSSEVSPSTQTIKAEIETTLRDEISAPEEFISALAEAMGLTGKVKVDDQGKSKGELQQGFKGAVDFKGMSEALITLFKSADASTSVHEMAHVARRFLFNRDVAAENRLGITDDDIKAAEDFSGVIDGLWDRKEEEKFARGFEKYIRDGKFPENSKLEALFAKLAKWSQSIYSVVDGSSIDIEITPQIRAVFDKLITRGETPVAKPKKKLPPRVRPTDNVDDFGVRLAITDAIRNENGLPESAIVVKLTDQDAWDEALLQISRAKAFDKMSVEQVKAKGLKKPLVGVELVADLLLNPRNTTKQEMALLAHEGLTREIALKEARKSAEKLPDDAPIQRKTQLENDVDREMLDLQNVLDTIRLQGSKAGLALQAMKLIVNRQFDITTMLSDSLRNKNKNSDGKSVPLTKAEKAEVEAAHKAIKEATELRQKLEEEQQRGVTLQEEVALLKKLVERAKVRGPSAARSVAFEAGLTKRADDALARLKARGVGRLFQESEDSSKLFQEEESFPDSSEIIDDLGTYTATYLKDGIRDLDSFTKKLTQEFGQQYASIAKQVFDIAQAEFKQVAPKARAKTPQELMNLLDKESPQISNRLIYNMALGFIRQDIEGRAVLDSVTSMLQEEFPEITREEVAVAFTGYGTVKEPSQEKDLKYLREQVELERLQLQIDEIRAGRAPKKTGQLRDKSTPDVRNLIKERNDLMKAMGIKVTVSKNQLRSSLDAAKTRLTNEALALEIAADKMERIPEKKRTSNYTSELKEAKDRRDAAKANYNEVFGIDTNALTDQQRVKTAAKLLTKRIAEEKALAEKGISERIAKSRKPITEREIVELRKELNALIKLRHELKAAAHPKKSVAEREMARAESAAKKAIERYENPKAKQGRLQLAPGQELARLWDLRDALKAAAVSARKAAREAGRMSKEQRAYNARVKALERSVADVEARAKRGDLSTKGRMFGPVTSEIAELQKRQKIARDALDALRALEDTRTPEEKLDDALVRASRRRKAKIDERIRNKDYLDTPKVDRVLSQKLTRAKFEEQESKNRWLQDRQKWNIKNAPLWEKISYHVGAFTELRKVIFLGLDLTVGRQGLVGLLSRPIVTTKNWFRALANLREEDELAVWEMLNDPTRTPAAAYFAQSKQFKLFGPFEEGYRNKEDMPDPEILRKLNGVLERKLGKAAATPINVILLLERLNRMHNNFTAVDIFSALIKTAPGTKPTKNEVMVFANATMNAMGRGSFETQSLDTGVQLMNHLLISTRYLISGFNLAVGQPILTTRGGYRGTARARAKVAYQIYAKTLVNASTIMSVLGYMAFGDDEEKWKQFINPLSNRFGVIPLNGVNYEPLKRLTPYISLVQKIIWGKAIRDGETIVLRGEGQRKGALSDEMDRFFDNRQNINLALSREIVTWEQWDGTKPTASSIATKAFGNLNVISDTAIIKNDKLGPVQKAFTIGMTHAGITANLQREAKKAAAKKLPNLKL